MHIRDLAVLAFRVVAIYMIAQGFLVAAQIGPMWFKTDGGVKETFGVLLLLSILAPILAGSLLWFLAPLLASIAVRDTSQTASPAALTIQDITHSAFVVVGVFILVTTLPDLIRTLVAYANAPEQRDASYGVALLFRCFLALALVLGARWMARALLWVRYARTSK